MSMGGREIFTEWDMLAAFWRADSAKKSESNGFEYDYVGDIEPEKLTKTEERKVEFFDESKPHPADHIYARIMLPYVAAVALRSYFRDRHAWGSHPQANFIDRLVAKIK